MKKESTQYWQREPVVQKEEDSYVVMGETLSSVGLDPCSWIAKMHWLSFLEKISHSGIAKVTLHSFLDLGNINHVQVLTSEPGFLSVSPRSDRVSFPFYMLTLQLVKTFYTTVQTAVMSRAVLLRSGHWVVLSFPTSSEDSQCSLTRTERSLKLEESQLRLFFTPLSILKVV